MDRLFRKTNIGPNKTPFFVLLIFATLFSAGCVIGTLLACNVDGSGEFFTDLEYSVCAADPAQLGFFQFAAGEVLVYAVLLLLGFTVFGVAVIPAVSFAKGFSFSFTFAAFVRLFAGADAKWTVFLFVTDAIFMLPAFFTALDFSFSMSLRLARSVGGVQRGHIRAKSAALTLVLCIASVILTSILKMFFFTHIISASIL